MEADAEVIGDGTPRAPHWDELVDLRAALASLTGAVKPPDDKVRVHVPTDDGRTVTYEVQRATGTGE